MSAPESSEKITPRRERFCEAYVATLSLTEAARRAGFSPRSAASYGWHLYHEVPAVRRRVQELLAAAYPRHPSLAASLTR